MGLWMDLTVTMGAGKRLFCYLLLKLIQGGSLFDGYNKRVCLSFLFLFQLLYPFYILCENKKIPTPSNTYLFMMKGIHKVIF